MVVEHLAPVKEIFWTRRFSWSCPVAPYQGPPPLLTHKTNCIQKWFREKLHPALPISGSPVSHFPGLALGHLRNRKHSSALRDLTVEWRRQELCLSGNERDVRFCGVYNSGFREILRWGYVEKVLHRSWAKQVFNIWAMWMSCQGEVVLPLTS